jgi:dTDP-4-amino-4,6-dideoxygalactose transaminase
MTDTAVPLLDLTRQIAALEPELTAATARVIKSARFILGPEVANFEAAAAAYLGAQHAVGVASGTDALGVALRGLDVGPGDVVLTSPFTFFATASAARGVGARLIFADIDPETYNLDPAAVREVLEGRSPICERLSIRPEQIKAIIPVHLYGQPVDVDAFEALSQEFSVPLVEDAAQAIGSSHGNRHIGNSDHLVCFSFFPSKNLGAFGDGGLITTNNEDHANCLRLLRAHGSPRKYQHERVGVNSRLDGLQAAILGVKLPHLDAWVRARRAHAAAYNEAFATVPDITPPPVAANRTHCYHQYTVRVANGQRDILGAHLTQHQIGNAIYYPIALHQQAALADHRFRTGDYPISELAAAEVLSLPIFPELTPAERDHVIDAVRTFYR